MYCTTLTQQFLCDLKLILKPIAQPCKTIIYICLTKPAPTNTKARYSLTLNNYIKSVIYKPGFLKSSIMTIVIFTFCDLHLVQCYTCSVTLLSFQSMN